MAERLGLPFVDLDEAIERREGATASALFAQRGEAYFRKCEREVTEELAQRSERIVVATGGGWVTNAGVVALLRTRGRIIYLATSPERAVTRLEGFVETRPLLAGPDPLGALRMLLLERRALYEGAADVVLPTDLLTVQEVTERVVELASISGDR